MNDNLHPLIVHTFNTFKQMVDTIIYNETKEIAEQQLLTILNDCQSEYASLEAKKQLLVKQLNYVEHLLSKIQ